MGVSGCVSSEAELETFLSTFSVLSVLFLTVYQSYTATARLVSSPLVVR